jgi:3-oxoacyl-[acyl-carrier protein] reductase
MSIPAPAPDPSLDSLTGRRALVTAASRGIGRAVAATLAARGAEVFITGTGDSTAATAQEIGAAGWARADFTEPGAGTAAAQAAAQALGPLDILVVNTGGPRPAPFLDLGDDEWLAAYHLILGSAVELSRACLPDMTRGGWGRIVYLTSTAGVVRPLPRLHLSNALRSAVAGLAQSLAVEAGPAVTTNVIATGAFDTDRHAAILENQARASGRPVAEVAAAQAGAIPARRFGRPDEMGSLIAFLCSEAAAYITGAVHVIDGGASLT